MYALATIGGGGHERTYVRIKWRNLDVIPNIYCQNYGHNSREEPLKCYRKTDIIHNKQGGGGNGKCDFNHDYMIKKLCNVMFTNPSDQ